ncbi:type II toxin-antitoxin system Phd/YefM family antitoxin [Pseudogulbenkiania ferrooxidans]|uniref:Antitoxin n=1 Tax=Pseudogulbenkiania ferrooxidans 2002 TaxID=279714 RepID=B9Z433_9NEIS|nr:type II toxin-antitoxin system prevent-host-death family antitoxin [Pseudogulbenkiania ferrooxidans]EEG08610.1 prevent-host-death family protein [Pseudogulbenkiania ferrooxidans 2002]
MDRILADMAVSVTELKRNFAGVLREAGDAPVAVINHNRPEAYLLSARHYEQLMDYVEDLEDAELIRQRQNEPSISVNLELD